MPSAALRRVAKGLYVLYIGVFSKEAEMRKSRILGADMTLLLSLCFLINKTMGIKAAGRFYKYFIINHVFLSILGQIFHTIRIIRVCGYLYRSCLLRRFITVGNCSIPINGLGGRIE